VAQTGWRQLLSADDGYELCPGAAAGEVTAAEAALTAVFPADLRQLYLASDGVFDRPGQWFVIWPLAEVITRNQQAWARDSSPSRRELVGFGDDGTGAPFCVPRHGGSEVSAWSPIDSEATLLAPSVAGFWSGWVAGTLPPH
jgi:SMI1 / KNR4 family (SUKH-1)